MHHPLPPMISAVSFHNIQPLYIQFVRISSNGDKRQEKLYKFLRHCSTSLETVEAVMAASCKAGREEVSRGRHQYRHLLRLPGKQALGDRNPVG
ncbi:hypothetical protein AVEN_254574-1 [Araneus ventricosus]|uniref:Uncharacterized protein n=1 Tax=Araneus ventricosus TaxID=182803 RepID=A0A4Y2PB20_ARAVE|nr:hypothetical protein AVEN_254574-1 [Araneus ventricosus]